MKYTFIFFTPIALLTLALTGCFSSQPDISGVWIPEHTPNTEQFYDYYVIVKMGNEATYSVKKVSYQIQRLSKYNIVKLPLFLGNSEGVVSFTKNNTYCYEGSLETDCFIYSDGKLRPSRFQNVFVKSNKNPPPIPVIR